MNHASSEECVFCKAMREEDGPGSLVVYRGTDAFVILNRFPYTSGRVMVAPDGAGQAGGLIPHTGEGTARLSRTR